jgi:hypothetical protein
MLKRLNWFSERHLRSACIESLERRLQLSGLSFSGPTFTNLNVLPKDVIVADMNGDGKADLLTLNINSQKYATGLSLLLGNGNGTFAAPLSIPLPNNADNAIDLADLTGDGLPDIIVAQDAYNSTPGSIDVIHNNGNGTFAPYASVGTFPNMDGGVRLITGDFTGDGIPDILVGYGTGQSSSVIMLLPGKGNGQFGSPITVASLAGSGSAPKMAFADFGDNGVGDFATLDYSTGSVTIYMGNNDGTFKALSPITTGGNADSISAIDLNGDGKSDLVVFYYNNSSHDTKGDIILNEGNGTFALGPQQLSVAGQGGGVPLDLNDSGKQGVGLGSGDSKTLVFYPSNGNGTFGPGQDISAGLYPHGLAVGDFNGDGKPDLVVGTYNTHTGTIGVLLNTTSGLTPVPENLKFQIDPVSTTAGSSIGEVTVAIRNVDGDIIQSDDNDVTLSIYSGPSATLTGTTTVAAHNGVATFSGITINTAGTFRLTASDSADNVSSTISSFAFDVSTPVASTGSLFFSQQPTQIGAGTAFNVVVLVNNLTGNTITSDSSTVTLSVANGPNGASGLGTLSVQAVNGTATFSGISFHQSGTYTLTATDSSATEAAATSQSITINPGPVAQLAFAPRSGAITAGVVISPAIVVDVEDQFGNLVGGQQSDVGLTIQSGPSGGVLNGPEVAGTVAAAVANGMATFSSLTLSTAGTYTLLATDFSGNITTASSSALIVSGGSSVGGTPAKLAFVAQPQSTIAGDSLGTLTVELLNSKNQPVNATGITVQLSIASGAHGASLDGRSVTASTVNGIATFTGLTINDYDGAFTLKASCGKLTAGTSAKFTLAPDLIVFGNQPAAQVTAGAKLPAVSVDLEDAGGNLILNGNSSIVLAALNSSDATVHSYKATAKNGVAKFSSIVLDTAGTYQLDAQGTGLSPITSDDFTVVAGTAAKLVFGAVPSPIFTFDNTIVNVMVDDKFGNILADDDSTVITLGLSPKLTSADFTPQSVTVNNGTAQFTEDSIGKSGSYVFTATAGKLTAKSSKFIVHFAPP